jgi:hypothetical protein
MELVTTHETDGIARLTERMRKPRISALLASWLAEVQEVERASWDLLTKRSPATAEGVVLDILGKIVGQPRLSLTDELYRIWISGRILVNASSGRASQLLAIARKLCGEPVWLEEQYPGWVTLHARQPIPGDVGSEIAKLLRLAKAAGIGMHFRWSDTVHGFRFSQTGASMMGSDKGFTLSRLSAVSEGRNIYTLYIGVHKRGGALLVVL